MVKNEHNGEYAKYVFENCNNEENENIHLNMYSRALTFNEIYSDAREFFMMLIVLFLAFFWAFISWWWSSCKF
jgi:hypothetical protein